MALGYDTSANIATVTFPGILLSDGVYNLSFAPGSVTDASWMPVSSIANATFFVLAGDGNHDAVVNALDFNALASHFGQSSQSFLTGDFNYDGTVNTTDFNVLASNFGKRLIV